MPLKKKMWKEILDLKKKMIYGLWVIGGYFNSITKSSEIKGRLLVKRSVEQRQFKELIEESNLVDFPCIGNSFT